MDIAYIYALLLLGSAVPVKASSVVRYENTEVTTIVRQNNGDEFQAKGAECNSDTCVGISSGTAAVTADIFSKGFCTCQCHRHLPTFREDLQICVDDIHECVLAPFVSTSMSQQIPLIYLPFKDQIIHPNKQISFAGILTPICAVSGAKFLTDNGWVDLRNPIDTDVPFKLFRDDGRTFLQWNGETELRNRMGGRLVLVHLMCRELETNQGIPQELQPIFTPCVAFRVAGSPVKYLNNISEVVFAPDAQEADGSSGLRVSEIVAIGICSVLLGLIYVASVFLYLHLRKRRKEANQSIDRRDNRSISNVEEGIIKNNPLLGLGRHFTQPETSFTDSTGSDTDVTPDILQDHDDRKKAIQITSALIHPYHHDSLHYSSFPSIETCHQDASTIERLPEENVSIVETLEGREDRPDNVKAIGTARKKLYFNPAYFEPHLLLTPPPAAIEFLFKIREVITIAKQKMATKRFSPSLMGIPEEENPYYAKKSNSQGMSSRRSSQISLKRENSRRKLCSGCPDCEPRDFKTLCGRLPEFPSLAACDNCTSTATECKQRSIRKWLEDIPVLKPLQNAEDLIRDYHSRTLQSLPVLACQKRVRSPTRSLPPHQISSPICSLSPKPSSEKAKSPKPIYAHKPLSLKSVNKSTTGSYEKKRIIKPNCPPPPLPTQTIPQDPHYDVPPSKQIDGKILPPPDMIHEAMAVDNKEEVRIPTITKKKMNAVISEFASQHGLDSGSSPESSTKNQIDYETDSLERSCAKGFSTPTEYADVSSSQPSPSLSAALPMDEEMTMRNAIINTKTGNMTISKLHLDELQVEENEYELIVLKKPDTVYNLPELLQRGNLVSEVYVNNGYNYGSTPSSGASSNCSTLEKKKAPKITYEDDKPGHLLIEVEDCPDNYIRVEDSDSFEPDTLDRKPSKLSIKDELKQTDGDYDDSLERPKQILLRTTGSFKSDALASTTDQETDVNFTRNYGSLREIYEAKARKALQDITTNETSEVPTWNDGLVDFDYKGRILTLEERHYKRQRRSSSPVASDIPPDVIPPHSHDNAPIYEHPKPPRKIKEVDAPKPPLPPKIGSGTKTKEKPFVNEKPTNKTDTLISSSNSSDYETMQQVSGDNKCDTSILRNFIHTNDILFKNGINNQFILQATTITSTPNLLHYDDRLGLKKHDDKNFKFRPVLGRYLLKPEDSGYLSTDSNESKMKKIAETDGDASLGAGSETDESLGDGHSESGAESVETHSVFFDSFRKPACMSGSLDSGVDSDLKPNSTTNYMDDGASTDSENMSFKTVVTTRRN